MGLYSVGLNSRFSLTLVLQSRSPASIPDAQMVLVRPDHIPHFRCFVRICRSG